MIIKIKTLWSLLTLLLIISCEENISDNDLKNYKSIMDQRLGHLGNAIIMQGRLLDAFNLRNDRADEDHFKEAEELIKSHLDSFGRPDELMKLKIPNSQKLRKIHNSLIETSKLMIASYNSLEDNAWLGGSVSFAEMNLDTARFNFQNAVKVVYQIDDKEEKIKPLFEYKEYDVGEQPKSELKVKDSN
tara:strand:- start:2024 stop:2587 length:564 start_codon:yes stop_codon:yes gene_type:complete